MVHKPKEHLEKKGEPEIPKRRNSLTDSTSSTSGSSASSNIDSDEACSSGTQECKSTMTSLDLPSELYRRTPLCTDIPTSIGQNIRFTSLSNQFPLPNTQPGEPAKKTKESKKQQEKREKKERREREAALRRPLEQIQQIKNRQMLEDTGEMRREVAKLYNINEIQPVDTYHMRKAAKKVNEQDKLQATIGFGIAATGLYDKCPEFTSNRLSKGDIYRNSTYTELVGRNTIDWRKSYDQACMKDQGYTSTKVDWEAITAQRQALRVYINKYTNNKWIQKLLNLILDGKIKKVWRRIVIIQKVLKCHPGDHPYTTMSNALMLEIIMQGLVKMLVNPELGFNIIMYLVTHSHVPSVFNEKIVPSTPCFKRKHNDCMLAELILSSLNSAPASCLLSQATTTTQRKAIHYAALAGSPCQLEVLLKYDVDTNVIDSTGQAAIHYALARNNTLMLRQLMWHGTDLSLVNPIRRRMPIDDNLPDTIECSYFLKDRLKSLERAMSAWLKALCAGKWKIGASVTALHAVRITSNGDSSESSYEPRLHGLPYASSQRTLHLAIKEDQLQQISQSPEHSVMLFALPVSFTPLDAIMPASYPHIVRTKLVVENDYLEKAAQVITSEPTLKYCSYGTPQCHQLPSAFHECHNGFVYAWQFPKYVDTNSCPILNLSIDSSQMAPKVARHSLFFIQAYSVANLMAKQKCD